MDLHAENLKSIVEQGREMAKAGHFDSAGILKKVDAFDRRSVNIILVEVGGWDGRACLFDFPTRKLAGMSENNYFVGYVCRFESLKAPVADRRRKLEDSLKLHQFNFDADNEMQWIKEHTPAATSTDYGKNLIDAQNKNKNHKVIHALPYINSKTGLFILDGLATLN